MNAGIWNQVFSGQYVEYKNAGLWDSPGVIGIDVTKFIDGGVINFSSLITTFIHEVVHVSVGGHAWVEQGRKPSSSLEIKMDPAYRAALDIKIDLGVAIRIRETGEWIVTNSIHPDLFVGDYYTDARGRAYRVVSDDNFRDIDANNYFGAYLDDPNAGKYYEPLYRYIGDDGLPDIVFEQIARAERAGRAAQIGDIIGSSLGNALAGDGVAKGIIYSSLLGEIGERLGAAIGFGGSAEAHMGAVVAGGLGQFGSEVAARAGQSAIGTISSWLSLELGEALGLKGFGAELFTSAGSTVTSHVIGNLLNVNFGVDRVFYGMRLGDITEGFAGADFNLTSALGSALGAFIGAKLGAMVVNPQTHATVTLSSIGSAVGAYYAVAQIGTSVFGTSRLASVLGNMILPGIGAFVGFVLGALVGNLFGRKKPKIPTANAEVYLDYTSDKFQLGASSAANGGNLGLVRNMAESARDTLNGFLSVLAGDMPYQATSWGYGLWRNGGYISTPAGVQSFYGHTGGQLWVKLGNLNGVQQNVASADDAVSKGVMWSIKQTQVIGGDIFAKRALANSAATDLTALLGDLQIASDYRFYANNRELINGYITGAYNSLNQGEKDYYAAHKAVIDKAHTKGVSALDANELNFYNTNKATIDKIVSALEDQAIANPWIITLQRINELKLDQWSYGDFNGGLQGFLTSLGVGAYGTYLENVKVTDILGGMTLSAKGPTVQEGVFSTLPQALDAPIGNDLLNPHWRQNSAGWWMAQSIPGAASFGVNLNADWSGSGNDVMWSRMEGTPAAGGVVDVRSELIASQGGKTYEFSVKAGQHRSRAEMFVEFYDANQNWLGAHLIPGQGRVYGGWQGDLNNFDTISGQLTAPPGTAYRRIGLRMFTTGENDPYAFFTQPVTREVGGAAIDWSDRGGAVRVEDLSKIGYTRLTEGNTAGRDFLDFSARTAAVGWSDWHEETTEGYWEWRSWGFEPGMPVLHPDPGMGGVNGDYVWVPGSTYAVTGGDDIVIGSRFGDYLAGAAGWDWIDGGDGDDTIEGGDGNDVLLGGGGRDRLVGGAGDDYLVGGAGDDHPWHGDGFGAGMWGGAGNDTIVFSGGIDAGFGEDGDDLFLMEQDGYTPGLEASGNYDGSLIDFVDAGSGSDTISYERFTTPITAPLDPTFWPWAVNSSAMPKGGINGVRVALWNHPTSWDNGDAYWADAKYIMGDWVKGVENVTGSQFNDYLWGDSGSNVLKGGGGDDFLDGHDGDDILEGGAGADYLFGSNGNDVASYEGSSAGVFIDLSTGEAFGGHATGDRFNSIEGIRGSRYADELKGDDGVNRIEGGGGDDWIVATKGNDTYVGGEGIDTVDYSAGFAGSGTVLGLNIQGSVAYWRATDGAMGTHTLSGVEHIIGTAGADTIVLTAADEFIRGGKGNDTLNGGGGSDTYYFELGDGFDTINETNVGSNVVSFGEGIGFNQLSFTVVAGPSGHMTIHYSATDSVRVNGNLPNVKEGKLASADDNRLKVIDMNGSGQLDVSQFEIYRGGTAGADTLSGIRTLGDFLVGFGGNDTIYGMQPGQWEDHGNIIIGGAGNDTSFTSVGDDQFAFERGSGRDTINDTGGDDTLVFGPNVAADDVIYKVVGNDLYIGIAEAANPNLEAHQVTDYVRVVGGGVKWVDVYSGYESFNTVEFINAGGTWIDLRKLNINWTVQNTYGGGVMPIVFDLGGNGLELTGVDSSMVVSQLSSGELARTSWVGPTDGILAVDRNGDGQINMLSEISFVQDKEGAQTDLEGLQAWDTNGDGKLNALDEGWGQLKIWVDRNQNGRSTNSELRTLEEVGITEIDLTGTATGNTVANTRDSFVHNTLSFTWASGETGTAYDVQLARKLLSEYGLSVDQVRSIWGDDRSVEGELGRLVSGDDFSFRSPVMARRREVIQPPNADFSDHDDLYAEDEARWAEELFGDGDGGSSANVTDPNVRASLDAFFGQGGRGAYGATFRRPHIDGGREEDITDVPATSDRDELVQTSARRVGDFDQPLVRGQPESQLNRQTGGGDLNPALAAAADLISAERSDLWAPVEFGLASTAVNRSWWLQDGDGAHFSDELLSPVVVEPIEGLLSVSVGAEQLSQHQKLTQALATFGRDKGAAAAVWKRSGEAEVEATSQMLGASGSRFAALARMPA